MPIRMYSSSRYNGGFYDEETFLPSSMCYHEDLATAPDTQVVTLGNLASAVAAAPPGRQLLIAPGTYSGGTLTLNASGTSAAPVVIRPNGVRGSVTLNNAVWSITGDHLVIMGFNFNDPRITIKSGATFTRITRCQYRQVSGWATAIEAATDTRIDHNDFADYVANELPKSYVQLRNAYIGDGSLKRVQIDRNYIHDTTPSTSLNGCETLGTIASGVGAAAAFPGVTIEYNLFSNISIPGETEIIGAKFSGGKVQYNTFLNCNESMSAPRTGINWEIRSNWIEDCVGGYVQVGSKGSLIIGNNVSGNTIRLQSGEFYWAGTDEDGHPATESCRFIGNISSIAIGFTAYTPYPPRNNIIEEHTGSISQGTYPDATLIIRETTTEPYEAAVKLTTADVGLNAADPLCTL